MSGLMPNLGLDSRRLPEEAVVEPKPFALKTNLLIRAFGISLSLHKTKFFLFQMDLETNRFQTNI